MPFTPFHMGPGLAIKALMPRYFSLTSFGFAQLIIDVEPLVHILRHDSVLHGVTHTYLGALLVGVVALVVGKFAMQSLLRSWNGMVNVNYLRWLQVNSELSWPAVATGVFIGTFSHIVLDSMMHIDMQPFWPLSTRNSLLNVIPASWVYLLCSGLGVFGVMCLLTRKVFNL